MRVQETRDEPLPFKFTLRPFTTSYMASTEITLQAAQDKVENLAERDADSTESEIRYLAYGARLRTALRAGTRYIAYVRSFHPFSLFLLPIPSQGLRLVTSAKRLDLSFLHGLSQQHMEFRGYISAGRSSEHLR